MAPPMPACVTYPFNSGKQTKPGVINIKKPVLLVQSSVDNVTAMYSVLEGSWHNTY